MPSNLTNAQEILDKVSPLIYTSGKELFKKYMDSYAVHSKGFFILAPSGSGKTYYVNHQKTKDWIDGDALWDDAGAFPAWGWWTAGLEVINDVDRKSDIITIEAKKLGLWIIGASNYWLTPDAVVIPEWETHKRYIRERESKNYDGGATSNDYSQVLSHRDWIQKKAKDCSITVFQTIKEAADYLRSEYLKAC